MVRVWMREGVLTYYVLLERLASLSPLRGLRVPEGATAVSRTVYVFLRSFAGGHLAEWQFRRILV